MADIILIACVAENGVIGRKGGLPWYLPVDLKHFKERTMNNTVVMGRKTFDSILERIKKPLPNRKNIVVSRQNMSVDGVTFCSSIDDALSEARNFGKEIYIIGGQTIYEQTIHLANRLEITRVYGVFEGDAFFPRIDESWIEVGREDGEENGVRYSFLTYRRRNQTI